ncbi:HK97-gp10 family putative phage morphogenesis protein [Rhizobium laguerreae]|uniref:HK97-gp10 family putative phage morphogenesis protein n=1 Tax=Rhizobium laguerreae TaxID=1076926 RepID=UPI001C927166|nr:HK97-gp10 family putative phage morphogenesis protein [Rhizobium laguerreae]MBY3386403.1 HK97 gp10 family phage protein [Rhizobium laguerreae]MBY3400486.1 HK97 gp10 family phage protein [Rhizobium laguerreae]MBY3407424.1 HK97 gp10 family phage protein [Rhizobium laguerreae]
MTVKGLKELQRKLDRLPAVAKARIREAMEQGADEIVTMMRSLVPTDRGDLRDSIAWTYGRAPKGALSLGKVQAVGGDLTITIYAGNATAYYSRFVEFGTASHTAGGKFAGATIPAIAASPFFFVSFRANRKKVKSRITRAINKAAKEVAAGS